MKLFKKNFIRKFSTNINKLKKTNFLVDSYNKTWNIERFCKAFTIVNESYKTLLDTEKRSICVKSIKQNKKDMLTLTAIWEYRHKQLICNRRRREIILSCFLRPSAHVLPDFAIILKRLIPKNNSCAI